MQPTDQSENTPLTTTTETAGDAIRVAYHTPVFAHHGSAADIVRTNEGMGTDGGSFADDTLS